MNVLVVDDEPIIRLGLRTLVEWEQHGFRYAGDAEDGFEALQVLESLDVDIVITDLLMPRMDGLALIHKLKESVKPISIIVLSCMDDFRYVKEAMKLGAKDYIHKPTMEPESLLDTLQGVKRELEQRRHEQVQLQRWHRELESTKQTQLSNKLQAYLQTGLGGETIHAELFGAEAETGSTGSLISLLLYTGPAASAGAAGWHWTGCLAALPLAGDSVLLLVPAAAAGTNAAIDDGGVHNAAAALASAAERYFARLPQAPDWFVGAGMVVCRLADVLAAAALHERQLHDRFYSGSRNRLVPPVCPQAAQPGIQGSLSALAYDSRSDLLRCISHDNAEGALHHAEELCRIMKEQRPNAAKVPPFIQELLGLAAGYARERGYVNVDSYEDAFVNSRRAYACCNMEQVLELLIEALNLLAKNNASSGTEKALRSQNAFIRKALKFMQENYASPLSTLDIADHVKLSRSYLSDLYSKEMGEPLSETLTRIRLEEAKRRLRTGEMKVYEVAEAVGFPDAKTFAKTFKRVVGCSPKAFEKPQ
ncbi:response regulator [Paenibacillus sedimenti]|uniref:Response regulator n=1 Tax=Paenibacillus sedimenti TaxID=2770274 RepID=A0A926KUY9_9BACL|nr:response regulator [Paenibacillus sedimenti]MBD0382703.1 response regulator [Paenibacillus sedimenti]